MADLYVRSADGSDSDNGTTWALSKATAAGAAAIDAAGDSIFFSKNHSESTGSAVTLAFAGTNANPVRVLSVDDTGDPQPPTALSPGATIGTTGASNITIQGAVAVGGMTFKAGDGASTASVVLGASSGATQIYEGCTFELGGTGTGSRVALGSTAFAAPRIELVEPAIIFRNASQAISITRCTLAMIRGGVVSPIAGPSALVIPHGDYPGNLFVSGLDLSACPTTMNLVNVSAQHSAGLFVFRDCRLPSGWSGSLTNNVPGYAGNRYEMHNCDAGATNYRLWVEDYAGQIRDETTLVRNGQPLSWKMVGGTNCNSRSGRLYSPEIAAQVESGSPITLTVELLHDSATALSDDDCWLEVMYLGASGYPLGTWASSRRGNQLAAAVTLDASSATWTTTGMSNPNKQLASVTVTPQMDGWIHARVVLAKSGKTIYVDPQLIEV